MNSCTVFAGLKRMAGKNCTSGCVFVAFLITTVSTIANAVADLKAQADPDNAGVDAFTKRYPKAVARNFDGKAGIPTEMDALIAYLQMLGTLVDFKLYNEKANLR